MVLAIVNSFTIVTMQLSSATYQNKFVQDFDGDATGNNMPRQTPNVFYSLVQPTSVQAPELLAWSEALAQELGLDKPNKKDISVLAGNDLAPNMQPYAARYGGHQFGHWAGQLGDGRAITLSELVAPSGKSFELQLKGAGPTPYSRRADGRAVLRSSVREYLMSEAMYYLGVPTTRALGLVTTGDQVLRDMFYDGHPAYEPGAIVMRVAPSFLRFGNYEIFAALGEIDNLKKLIDWTIEQHFPHITGQDKMLQWFREVVLRTAALMVEWMRVGFVHGVMNTDNMSILGLTIDYGPYSFVDDFDLNFTPNTTDLPGRRYAFGKQPSIAKWNLGCLAGALVPLFNDEKELISILEEYDEAFWIGYYRMMGNKIGIDDIDENDVQFIRNMEKMLSYTKPDMTMFFQLLIDLPVDSNDEEIISHFESTFYQTLNEEQKKEFIETLQAYLERVKRNKISSEERMQLMRHTNPRFVLRNYLLHQAIEGLEKGDTSLFEKLQQAMKEPYSTKWDEYFAKRPEWATEQAGCSMLSCSS
jgi:uncharacterized protein YdiU (UPF0061 family)